LFLFLKWLRWKRPLVLKLPWSNGSRGSAGLAFTTILCIGYYLLDFAKLFSWSMSGC
jgi:hypothetical protein